MSAHTPGPWVAEVYDDVAAAQAVGGFEWTKPQYWRAEWGRPASVWLVHRGGTTGLPGNIETIEANAHLISAAPDLLEALVDLLSYHDVPGPVDAPLRPLMDAAFAALRKAGRLT